MTDASIMPRCEFLGSAFAIEPVEINSRARGSALRDGSWTVRTSD